MKCSKKGYDKNLAEYYLFKIQNNPRKNWKKRKESRVYLCPICKKWHLTSQPKAKANEVRRKYFIIDNIKSLFKKLEVEIVFEKIGNDHELLIKTIDVPVVKIKITRGGNYSKGYNFDMTSDRVCDRKGWYGCDRDEWERFLSDFLKKNKRYNIF